MIFYIFLLKKYRKICSLICTIFVSSVQVAASSFFLSLQEERLYIYILQLTTLFIKDDNLT
jgi:hypothetical protein